MNRRRSSLIVTLCAVALGGAALNPLHVPPTAGVINELIAIATYGVVWFVLAWECGLAAEADIHSRSIGFPRGNSRWPLVLTAGLAAYGLLSAQIALLQFLAPEAAVSAGGWLVSPSLGGRVGANLHQPNHLATVLVWGAAAWVSLAAQGLMRGPLAWGGMALYMAGLVTTGSRTGALALGLLVLWALTDRRLSTQHRLLLGGAPALYGVASALLAHWGPQTDAVATTVKRLGFGDGMSAEGRWWGWRNTLDLIAAEPWLGVGFGNFHRAWMLTPLPDRNGELFTNTHNLVLTLLVEWGVPLGLLMIGLILAVVWKASRRAWADEDAQTGPARRFAVVMVAVIGLHSLLEYPLWYAHMALPTVMALWVAWGYDLRPGQASERQTLAAALLGMSMMVMAAVLWWDYQKVTVLYGNSYGRYEFHHNREAMAKGQDSWFFGKYADRVVIHSVRPQAGQPWPPELERAFKRGMHDVMYPQLMRRWAEAYAARGEPGDLDRARHIARRVWELRITQGASWFEPCRQALKGERMDQLPFQCEEPKIRFDWRDFTH